MFIKRTITLAAAALSMSAMAWQPSEEWKAVMKSNGLIPFHPKAGEFESFVTNQVQDIEDLSREIGLLK